MERAAASIVFDCEMLAVAVSRLSGSFSANAGSMVCRVLRMVAVAVAAATLVRRALLICSSCLCKPAANACTASVTPGATSASATAFDTTGRAAVTSLFVLANFSVA